MAYLPMKRNPDTERLALLERILVDPRHVHRSFVTSQVTA